MVHPGKVPIRIPEGAFLYPRCIDDNCIYCDRWERDLNGRFYCAYYDRYFHQNERDGCLSFRPCDRLDRKCAECLYADIHDWDPTRDVWCRLWARYVKRGYFRGFRE